MDLEDQTEATGYRSARSGPPPALHTADSLVGELDAVAKHVRAWLDAGAVPETIAVLVHDKFQRERVVNALGERGIQARAVDRDRPPAGRVLVMTMHRAKGMEFSKVVLTDVGSRSAAERPGWTPWTRLNITMQNCGCDHWSMWPPPALGMNSQWSSADESGV